ncbi:hypothetical protein EJB05_17417, partial [Eragrostis curvula]
MAPASPSNPRHCTRQLWFLLPFLVLSGADTFATADLTSYSSHCPSPAPSPDSHTEVGDDVELLKPFHLSNGFFSLLRDPNEFYSRSGAGSLIFIPDDPGNYFSFIPHGVSRTTDPALLHLTATLTLFGRRDEPRNISSQESFWRMYEVAVSFYLDGYYSSTTSELCMVGTGTEFADTDRPAVKQHFADVAVRLRIPSRPSLTDPFITGRLEGADFEEPVSLVAYAEGDVYNYKYSGRASCPPAAAMATARRALQPQHGGGFSCDALRSQLIFKYKLEYGSSHEPSNTSSLPRLHEPVMIVNQVRCAANGAVRLYAVFPNDGIPWPPMDHFLVEEQAVVADGFWDAETSRLCLHACLVAPSVSGSSAMEVRECGIGMSFWFPAVWTVRDRSATAGLLWNASQLTASGGNSSHAGAVSNPITATSTFRERIRTNLSDVKYTYDQTMLETATRHYLKAGLSNSNKTKVSFLGNHSYWYRDLEFEFFTDKDWSSGHGYPVSIGSAMVDGDKLAAEYSFSRHAATEMKQSRLVNVSYGILFSSAPRDWPIFSEIKAEGVYDTKTGFLSMVGCRELNVTTDCQVLITVQFDSSGYGKGRISSLRGKTDGLHFKAMDITIFSKYSQQVSESIRRMDLESIIKLASTTLSCVFAVLQILHTKRNRDAAPATSITMLVVLALGYATPLVLDLQSLLGNRGKLFIQLSGNGMLELNELVRKVPALIGFALQLRLLQLVWSGRRSEDRRSGAEWRVLRVCLPLYLLGAAVTAAVHAENSRAARRNPLMVRFGRDAGTLGEALASYAGLVLDGFLLPQVVLNAVSGSSAKAISPWFYFGGTVTRLAPHVYDAVRVRPPRYGYAQKMEPSYVYASPRDGLFGVAWDVVVTCGAATLALLLFLQQRLGGDFFQRSRCRSNGYEMVSTFRS